MHSNSCKRTLSSFVPVVLGRETILTRYYDKLSMAKSSPSSSVGRFERDSVATRKT